ncbi:conserved hypothetical protein [Talaromyces stipitatus ATCC 10500]|uniref:DUF7779 domain-containing protein n=1 Tax=Talaromyces stipitatus (strain ATCC 10500 / CBS 375.48 / QM 6759 / NRRL 1006) TaxID=441959 RepID=B8LXV3_TALSN|nr:uncharacterized protein TSTA_062550 [Talaromyces stipitatus ATCC 10500]EED22768.1 conserved hypothetical protein [Talaromyces stipitatus ATCC 10500]
MVERYRRLHIPALAEFSDSTLHETTNSYEDLTEAAAAHSGFETISRMERPTSTPASHVVSSAQELQSQQNAVNLPLYKIDFPENTSFVGRSDILEELDQTLTELAARPENRAYAIYGIPGIGKTQTALKFAYNHKQTFKSILWASAETKYKLIQSLSEYAVLLGIVPNQAGRDPHNDAERLMQWYKTTDTPWLLIFDNAVDPTLFLDYWPRNKRGAILVTTQLRIFATEDYCGQGKELLQLDEASAIQFLQSSVPDSLRNTEAARAIVQRVGCLPVAIKTSVGLIREAGCSLDDYNKEWNDPRTIIDRSDVKYADSRDARYNKGLRDLFAKSLQNLDLDARALVNVFSLMDDEHIPEEMLRNDLLAVQLPFLKHRARLIRDLIESCLIGPETEAHRSSSRRFHIHRMIRAFVQMEMKLNDRKSAYESASLLLNARVVTGGDPKFAGNKSYFQHVQALWEYYQRELAPDDPTKVDNKFPVATPALVQLLRKTSWSVFSHQHTEKAMTLTFQGGAIE